MKKENDAYEKLRQLHRESSDTFTTHATQTLNLGQKSQNEMTIAVLQNDFSCQAVSFEINDESKKFSKPLDEMYSARTSTTSSEVTNSLASVSRYVKEVVDVAILSPGCLLEMHLMKRPSSPQKGRGEVSKSRKPGAASTTTATTVGAFLGNGNSEFGMSGMVQNSAAIAVNHTSGSHANASIGIGASTFQSTGGRSSRIQNGMSKGVSGVADNSLSTALPIQTGDYMFGPEPGITYIAGTESVKEREKQWILSSPNLLKNLLLTERAVLQNIYHNKQKELKDTKSILKRHLSKTISLMSSQSESKSETGPVVENVTGLGRRKSAESVPEINDVGHLKRLFHFRFPSLIRDLEVTTMVYHPTDITLLVVGYGTNGLSSGESTDDSNRGLVLFWSPRNPDFPERVLQTSRGVSSLAFSKITPNILALGMQTGDLAIYDLSRDNWEIPKEVSDGMEGCHSETIW